MQGAPGASKIEGGGKVFCDYGRKKKNKLKEEEIEVKDAEAVFTG